MPRKKVDTDTKIVKITHPVMMGNRLVEAGETVTAPAELAREWIETERAADVAAEVTWQPDEQ